MSSPDAPPLLPSPLSLGLRLMDHQILGEEAEMLGNVDDVVLEERDGRLLATALLRGPGAWAERQPGALGRWGTAVWRRLDPREDPRPQVLPLEHVLRVDSGVHVDRWAEEYLVATDGLELWLRRHVVSRIPGARGGEHPFGGVLDQAPRRLPELELDRSALRLSGLLGAPVVEPDGRETGRVVEVRAEQAEPKTSRVGDLVVRSLVVGRHTLGGQLGYRDDPDTGPALLRAALRRLHAGDREVAAADVVRIDRSPVRVVVRP